MARCASSTSSRDRTVAVRRSWRSSSLMSSTRSATTTTSLRWRSHSTAPSTRGSHRSCTRHRSARSRLLRSGWRLRQKLSRVTRRRRHRARRFGRTGCCVRLVANPTAGWCGSGFLPFPSVRGTEYGRCTGARVARRFDAAIVISQSSNVRWRGSRYPGPVWTIPNARNPARFESVDRDDASRRLHAELDVRRKRVRSSASSVIWSHRSNPSSPSTSSISSGTSGCDAHLVFAGDGPLRSGVEQRVAERDPAIVRDTARSSRRHRVDLRRRRSHGGHERVRGRARCR